MKTTMINIIKKYYPLLAAPLLTMLTMVYVFSSREMYPYGDGSIAWCDMNQQVIPFMMNMKDLLSGNDSVFLNMHNAGGMSFFGVFCFFLSSPLNLLTAFVRKEDMIFFVNILVLIKLTFSSLTASLYFVLCKDKLNRGLAAAFGVMYALCGYGMLFYQNIMWLDIMILFPVLMIGLDRLIKKQSILVYMLSLAAVMIANFYIGYMVVVFILLYMGVYLLLNRQRKETSVIALKFIIGSGLAALLSAFIWLPSLLQVTSSGRLKSLEQNLKESAFLTSYTTILPLLYCTAIVLPVILLYLITHKKLSSRQKGNLLLLGLLVVPFFIEPINLMWHTGDYMSFPARYGFITVFMGLCCCGDYFEECDKPGRVGMVRQVIVTILCMGLIYQFSNFADKYITDEFKKLTRYTSTLWGDKGSFDGLSKLFVLAVAVYAIFALLHRKKLINTHVLALLVTTFCVFESMGSIRIYMTSPALNNPQRTTTYVNVTELSDKIQDDSFYRVATDTQSINYNMIGALGYPSISHYSSLTGHNFMVMQRQLGYSTVWMKSGANGGTELTNALYSVKYKIKGSSGDSHSVYSTDYYSIEQQPFYTGMGLVSGNAFDDCTDIPEHFSRAQAQQYLFEKVFNTNDQLIVDYPYDKDASGDISYDDGKYDVSKGSLVRYEIDIADKQSLYADVYDRFSNKLSEDYFESVNIRVNNRTVRNNYPGTDDNGLYYLGSFENCHVTIDIEVNQTIRCKSFGVFGLKQKMLQSYLEKTPCANLNIKDGKLVGGVEATTGQTCFLAFPYDEGITIKVNGKSVPYRRVMTDFVAFDLQDGWNSIEISITPKGWVAGVLISLLGLVLVVLYGIFGNKLLDKLWRGLQTAGEIAAIGASILCFLFVYAFPLLMIL